MMLLSFSNYDEIFANLNKMERYLISYSLSFFLEPSFSDSALLELFLSLWISAESKMIFSS